MIEDKCWCGRFHYYHGTWRNHIIEKNLICYLCYAWKWSDIRCNKCLNVGIQPIPLSEFYENV